MTSVAFHVDPLFFQAPGGTGTYIRHLVPALVRQDPGLEVKLFHARFEEAVPERWMRSLWVEELPRGIRGLYPRWNLTGRPGLPSALASLDLVHAPSSVAVPPAAERQKLVVTVHDLAFLVVPHVFPPVWRYVFRIGLRAAVKRADAIIAVSRNTAEDLLSRTKVDPARVHVIPEAAAVPQEAGDPEETIARLKVPRPFLLFVGTLEPRKNLVRLIRAYRRAAASGLPHALVLAGPLGWRHQTLLREIALYGPGDVVLTGPLAPLELDALYRSAAAFVYPALYEGFGLPVLEAMARGVPTICSNTSSLPEVAGDAAVGVNPASVREIASAIEVLLTDPARMQRLSDRGRARAERFSWDETARLTLQVYEKALGR
ncbi:MAG: glycosyltransferase family 4 protein [Actinomycetota bacterium]|nr:glycosyltransferase family 4 protein [Actinomycetota bacterium]